MTRTTKTLVILITLAVFTGPVPAMAYEPYGKITPSGPFHLWLGINKHVQSLTIGSAKARAMRAIKSRTFRGKSPGDVLRHMVRFRGKLNRMRAKLRLTNTTVFRSPSGEKVSPAIVYINSGHVYDAMVELMLNTNSRDQAYRDNFLIPLPQGKSPSDVYGLADLAIRKIDTLL